MDELSNGPRMDWLTVGSSFDAASFRQKQEEALKASTAAQGEHGWLITAALQMYGVITHL